jgi:hypothetical protein
MGWGLTGLIVLGLQVWSILSVVGSRADTGAKVLWVVLILFLPILGFVIWLIAGPRTVR